MSEKSRIEEIMEAILSGKTENLPEPQSRMEAYLHSLAGRMQNVPYSRDTGDVVEILKDVSLARAMSQELPPFYGIAPIDETKTYAISTNVGTETVELPVQDLISMDNMALIILGDAVDTETLEAKQNIYGVTIPIMQGHEDGSDEFGTSIMVMIHDPNKLFTGFGIPSDTDINSITFSLMRDDRTTEISKIDNKYLDMDWIPKYDATTRRTLYPDIETVGDDLISFATLKLGASNDDIAMPKDHKFVVRYAPDLDTEPVEYTCIAKLITTQYGDNGSWLKVYVVGNTHKYSSSMFDTGEPFMFTLWEGVDTSLNAVFKIVNAAGDGYANIYIDNIPATTKPLPLNMLPSNVEQMIIALFNGNYKQQVMDAVIDSMTIGTPKLDYGANLRVSLSVQADREHVCYNLYRIDGHDKILVSEDIPISTGSVSIETTINYLLTQTLQIGDQFCVRGFPKDFHKSAIIASDYSNIITWNGK